MFKCEIVALTQHKNENVPEHVLEGNVKMFDDLIEKEKGASMKDRKINAKN